MYYKSEHGYSIFKNKNDSTGALIASSFLTVLSAADLIFTNAMGNASKFFLVVGLIGIAAGSKYFRMRNARTNNISEIRAKKSTQETHKICQNARDAELQRLRDHWSNSRT